MNTDEKHIRGIVCIQVVDFVRKHKGDAGVAQLEQLSGDLFFDNHAMYPLRQFMELHKHALIIVFGAETDEGYRALGEHTYELFSKTLIGATLTNVGTTPKELLIKLHDIWGSVADFGERTIQSIDETKKECTIKIADDPRNPGYIIGILQAAFKKLAITSCTIKLLDTTTSSYTLFIRW